ncbi:hypothetical protein BS329_09560 [Amycolatopsis coloradensis]|uniref:Peptidase S54 rhomboid domain-containing protein n=2 Tax=Amycolatopsis coloradensis TaxID=76021 RepID=A0A1R0KVM9_9PSEU|nr:hypothetical protein BS329_09560 [Amycolatopsis coloradensis]
MRAILGGVKVVAVVGLTALLFLSQRVVTVRQVDITQSDLLSRSVHGFCAILWAPLLHVSWAHTSVAAVFVLSVGFAVTSGGLWRWIWLTATVWLVSGFGAWLVGSVVAVGMSGVVLGWLGFLLAWLISIRNFWYFTVAVVLCVSSFLALLLLAVLGGSLPGPLFGFVTGVLAARWLAKKRRPGRSGQDPSKVRKAAARLKKFYVAAMRLLNRPATACAKASFIAIAVWPASWICALLIRLVSQIFSWPIHLAINVGPREAGIGLAGLLLVQLILSRRSRNVVLAVVLWLSCSVVLIWFASAGGSGIFSQATLFAAIGMIVLRWLTKKNRTDHDDRTARQEDVTADTMPLISARFAAGARRVMTRRQDDTSISSTAVERQRVLRVVEVITRSDWTEIVADLGEDIETVEEIRRQLAQRHGWCALILGLAQMLEGYGLVVDWVPEEITRQVKKVVCDSSGHGVRSLVMGAVVDMVVPRVCGVFTGELLSDVPVLNSFNGTEAARALRILAVGVCPAPEEHMEVREHALKLGSYAREILTDQVASLIDEWMGSYVTN